MDQSKDIIYLNNAATSYPKPETVLTKFNAALGAPPPSEHRSNVFNADLDLISATRKAVFEFFNIDNKYKLILTSGGTEALNLVLRGAINGECHIITSAAEHNAVLRPLAWLRELYGVTTEVVPVNQTGWIDPQAIENAIKPNTKAVIVSHASNVTGTIQDLHSISAICKKKDVQIFVDGCQGAGNLPLELSEIDCDAYAFTGHKALMGPPGIGGLLVKSAFVNELKPLIFGGAGYAADEELFVDEFPAKYEVGTMNYPGLAGLHAAIEWLGENEELSNNVNELGSQLASALSVIPGVCLIQNHTNEWLPTIISFTIDGLDSQEVSGFLAEDGKVVCRVGYCCAPLIHKFLGTEESGVVRLSLGRFNTAEEVATVVQSIEGVAKLAV